MLQRRILSHLNLCTKKLQKPRPVRPHLQNVRWTMAAAVDSKPDDGTELANAKSFEEMPSLLMVPWIGTVWMYFPIIGRYSIEKNHIASIDKRRRLGDIFREKFGSLNMVISYNVDDMKIIYKNEGPHPCRGEFSSLKAYRESRPQWYKSTGVLILQGEEWKDLRSKTQKHLMKPRAVQAYLNPMQDVARDFVKKMLKVRDGNKEIPNFLEELYRWALESVALIGLDTRLGCLDTNLLADSDGMKMINAVRAQFELMNKLEGLTGNLPLWKVFPVLSSSWRKFTKAGDAFTEIAFKYINRSVEQLKKNANSDDKEMTLLQSMLMTKGLDISGAMVTVADMLDGDRRRTAGIETTSHSVGYLLYHLAKNPDKQEILYQEMNKLLPRKEDRINANVFNEMKYLKACMKESMRLHPIIGGVARSLDHDVAFSGYRVPAGTVLVVAFQEIYRDKKYFSNPDDFLPERWLNREEKIDPYSFAPFGLGTRSCIGRRLAELEIICLATDIIRNFKVEYHHGDIDMYTRLINTPDKPLRFNFIER